MATEPSLAEILSRYRESPEEKCPCAKGLPPGAGRDQRNGGSGQPLTETGRRQADGGDGRELSDRGRRQADAVAKSLPPARHADPNTGRPEPAVPRGPAVPVQPNAELLRQLQAGQLPASVAHLTRGARSGQEAIAMALAAIQPAAAGATDGSITAPDLGDDGGGLRVVVANASQSAAYANCPTLTTYSADRLAVQCNGGGTIATGRGGRR
jgi:hypothetical protein